MGVESLKPRNPEDPTDLDFTPEKPAAKQPEQKPAGVEDITPYLTREDVKTARRSEKERDAERATQNNPERKAA